MIQKEIDNEKNSLIRKRLKEKEKEETAKKIIETADLTYKALERERQLEEMIKQEEEMRQKERKQQLNILIKEEEEKKEKIEKRFHEKELETETLLDTQENEIKLKKAKEKAISKISEERSKLKKLLEQMRNKSELEEANLKSKLTHVRNEINSKVKDANIKGNQEFCKTGLKTENDRDAYCEVRFKEDFVSLLKCKDESEFCVTCCEAEFGSVYLDLRKNCLTEVCYQHI